MVLTFHQEENHVCVSDEGMSEVPIGRASMDDDDNAHMEHGMVGEWKG